eukprot:44535-Eustigmatos_ZCMA.PRE.2
MIACIDCWRAPRLLCFNSSAWGYAPYEGSSWLRTISALSPPGCQANVDIRQNRVQRALQRQ